MTRPRRPRRRPPCSSAATPASLRGARGLVRVALAWVLVLVVVQTVPAAAGSAAEQARRSRPRIHVDPGSARPGELVLVELSGWASTAATVTVCGNLALRGSTDCDVRAGQGVPLAATGGEGSAQLAVAEPPVPCPCVVRASSGSHDEVATVPLDIIGAPVAPVVRPSDPGPLFAVTVNARRSSRGVIDAARAALGGPAVYEVEVAVRNRTAAVLDAVTVAARAQTWSTDSAASFSTAPRPLHPGETWRHRAQVEVPAPSIGTLRWEAIASGAGPAVRAEWATNDVPVVLVAIVALLAGDLAAMLCRARRRRLRAGDGEGVRPRRRDLSGARRRRNSGGTERARRRVMPFGRSA